jgi:hypothetical protein
VDVRAVSRAVVVAVVRRVDVNVRDPRWLDFPSTFTCEPLLFVLGHMLPRPNTIGPTVASTATDAARMLATEASRNVQVVDDSHLLMIMEEPFEAVSTARAHQLIPSRCLASGLALELLRGPGGQPSGYTWTWLCQQLQIDDAPSYTQGIVKLPGIAAAVLPPEATEIPAGPGVWIWIVDGGGVDQLVFVDRARTIGRTQGIAADIGIDDPTVSRQHAAIVPFRGTWAIEDRGSTSGTWIDGGQVRSRCLLPGMVFGLGKSKLVVLSVR